jgi:CheY-like chemotaxis protein
MVLPANAQSPRFADSGQQQDASSGSARVALIDASPRPERAPPAASGEYSDARHHPAAPQQEALPARPGDSTGYVLVVDDDRDILSLIRMVLEEEGYHVITAENGEQALGRAAERLPALILLDLTMPVLNGWQTRERLAETWPDIPVVFMTAGFRAKAEAEAYRVAGYLAKPFDVDDLLRTVSRFIAHG